jgi:hypothetical protein
MSRYFYIAIATGLILLIGLMLGLLLFFHTPDAPVRSMAAIGTFVMPVAFAFRLKRRIAWPLKQEKPAP